MRKTRSALWLGLVFVCASVVAAAGHMGLNPYAQFADTNDQAAIQSGRANASYTVIKGTSITEATSYRINAAQSNFIAHVGTGGLLFFMAHTHEIAISDFSGAARLSPDAIQSSSLQMNIKAASLHESDPKFTEQEKNIITGEVKKQVLDTDEYPEITFQSSEVTGKLEGDKYKFRIGGELKLHGVTHHIVIPAEVTADNNRLHATGEFSILRSDYNVKVKSIKLGLIRASNKVRFTFDIVADRI